LRNLHMGRVIAIDGPSGAGKSTVSQCVAVRLGFSFLDTGALYRALALHLVRKGLSSDGTDDDLRRALAGVEVSYRDGNVCLNGEDVSEAIRTPAAGAAASEFSARRVVRDHLLGVQRDLAARHDIVAEGRDMTTVVFPAAWRKFYLDANVRVRALRRFHQLRGRGVETTMEEAAADVVERDRRDMGREIAPLRKADDALYIDTTDMPFEAVVETILSTTRR